MLSVLLAVYAALFGLVVGSYLNVVIHRLPRGVSTVLPPSSCPSCGTPIRWYDNLPLVSWLVLRGRCRFCRAPISWRYPLVEAVTAALFVFAWWRHGVSLDAAATALFGCLLLALAMIDAEHYLLPDRLTLPGIVIGLALQPFLGPTVFLGDPGLVPALVGAAFGGGVLFALWGGWYLLRGEEGMGLGDVKMLAMIGAFLGWKGVLVSLFVASLSGSVLGLFLIAAGRGGLRSRLPFGTFLAFGGAVALVWGGALVHAYARLL